MKTLLSLTFLLATAFSCTDRQGKSDGKLNAADTAYKAESFFKQVADFPTIKDTTQFIQNLRQTFNLEIHESPVQKEREKITTYKKVKIYGSDKDFIFIEYDWITGSMAEFPWKYQLLLTDSGKLVKALTGQRFEFIEIFLKQKPFLLIVTATAKGNGGHEIYKVSADTLENVYEGYYNYDVQTYDAHEDLSVFEPNELKIVFIDDNKDGFNDIVFTGQKLMLGKYTKDSSWYDVENGKPFTVENPASRHLVKYIFLYDKQSGHFKAKDNYSIGD